MRLLILILTFLLSLNSAFAIDWMYLKTPNNKDVYLDKDSITEDNNLFFYNIKYLTPQGNFKIVTIQSNKNNSLSARIKFYTEDEYDNLSGDYDNIKLNKTASLEPVLFGSVVHTCFKQVKLIKQMNVNANNIIFE